MKKKTFIDLFAGIGGMRLAFENAGAECVWANEKDKMCAKTYKANFINDNLVVDDIRNINISDIPEFDILCAGFPCQPFSIAGVSIRNKLNIPCGLDDQAQGSLFFEIVKILEKRKPEAFLLENVKNLLKHNKGTTFKIIYDSLTSTGYKVFYKIINARMLVPQNRERLYIVGFRDNSIRYEFPEIIDRQPVIKDILENDVDDKYTLSDRLWTYLQNRAEEQKKKGNGFRFSLVDLNSYARTLTARYYKDGSEILIPQKDKNPRKLTPVECARLQGFPDTFKIPVSDTQAYKQFGNSVVVPLVEILAKSIIDKLT